METPETKPGSETMKADEFIDPLASVSIEEKKTCQTRTPATLPTIAKKPRKLARKVATTVAATLPTTGKRPRKQAVKVDRTATAVDATAIADLSRHKKAKVKPFAFFV
jgi:hypothetical protein